MDLTQLANLGEFIGGIAVPLTFLYLAFQVRGAKKSLNAQTHHDWLNLGHRAIEMVTADPALAKIVNQGNQNPDALSGDEWERYTGFHFMMFNNWEYGYYVNRAGSATPQLWQSGDNYWGAMASSFPGIARFWKQYEHAFEEPFRSHVRSHLPAEGKS